MFLLPDLLEGNLAWYRRLQCEGNTQEYLGAQARIPTLPRRGKDWRIVSDPRKADTPPFSIYWEGSFPNQPLELSPDFLTSSLRTHQIMRSSKGWGCCIFLLFCRKQKVALGDILRFYAQVCTISSWCGFCHRSSTPLGKNLPVFELVVLSTRGTGRSTLVLSIQVCFNVLTQAYPEVRGLMFKG